MIDLETMHAKTQAVTKDKHLNIFYSEQANRPLNKFAQATDEEKAARLVDLKAMNFGVERVERLPFNIGYLDLRGFISAKAAANTLAAAMTLVANTELDSE